jgi:hypothetical protein
MESFKKENFNALKDFFDYIENFFDRHPYSWIVFDFTGRNRVFLKVDCEELRVCLQISFENRYPEVDVTDGYTREDLKKILKNFKE